MSGRLAGLRDDLTGIPGAHLVWASLAGTGLQVSLAVPAAVWVDALGPLYALASLLLFAGGTLACGWAFWLAVQRSRYETIGVGGLYFLAGCAPPAVQRVLMGSLAVQVAAGLAAASVRPYTSLAFGILVPMWGLGLAGAWGARHGTFPPRGTGRPGARRT